MKMEMILKQKKLIYREWNFFFAATSFVFLFHSVHIAFNSPSNIFIYLHMIFRQIEFE